MTRGHPVPLLHSKEVGTGTGLIDQRHGNQADTSAPSPLGPALFCLHRKINKGTWEQVAWGVSSSCMNLNQLLSCGRVVVLSLSCVQLFSDPMDCSPPGASVRGISLTRILEWIAISFSRGSSQPVIKPTSALAGGFFTTEPPGKPVVRYSCIKVPVEMEPSSPRR